jgi:hypothetical protein
MQPWGMSFQVRLRWVCLEPNSLDIVVNVLKSYGFWDYTKVYLGCVDYVQIMSYR